MSGAGEKLKYCTASGQRSALSASFFYRLVGTLQIEIGIAIGIEKK
jgi:hypothetical protein